MVFYFIKFGSFFSALIYLNWFAVTTSIAGTITIPDVKIHDTCHLNFDGKIEPGDAGKLKDSIEEVRNKAGQKSRELNLNEFIYSINLCLNSTGGDIDETFAIIKLIQSDIGVSTVVDAGNVCTSECAYLFMSGMGFLGHGTEAARMLHVDGVLQFVAPRPEHIDKKELLDAEVDFGKAVREVARLLRTTYQHTIGKTTLPRSLVSAILKSNPQRGLRLERIEQAKNWGIELFGGIGPANITRLRIKNICQIYAKVKLAKMLSTKKHPYLKRYLFKILKGNDAKYCVVDTHSLNSRIVKLNVELIYARKILKKLPSFDTVAKLLNDHDNDILRSELSKEGFGRWWNSSIAYHLYPRSTKLKNIQIIQKID